MARIAPPSIGVFLNMQACELDQTDVTLLYCLATTAMELGDFMHARQALEKVCVHMARHGMLWEFTCVM